MSSKSKSKREKSKISKLIAENELLEEEEEHELSFYKSDRVKLMKEVLKIMKPKKMKTMAPDCIKGLDIEEINSMLLEELLGISNKRLKYIFNGQNINEDTSSSSDPEEEPVQPIDIISLDDVSEEDLIIIDSDTPKKTRKSKIKKEPNAKVKRIKKEKTSKSKKLLGEKDKQTGEENLMSVLELLELQARARAIRSQLQIEAQRKKEVSASNSQEPNNDDTTIKSDSDDDEDAVIIESPTNDEIVITSSSDSEPPCEGEATQPKEANKAIEESQEKELETPEKTENNKQESPSPNKKRKIKLIRNRNDTQKSTTSEADHRDDDVINIALSDDDLTGENKQRESDSIVNSILANTHEVQPENDNSSPKKDEEKPQEPIAQEQDLEEGEVGDKSVDDIIVINVDQSEIDGIDE